MIQIHVFKRKENTRQTVDDDDNDNDNNDNDDDDNDNDDDSDNGNDNDNDDDNDDDEDDCGVWVDNLRQFDWESHDENINYNGCQEFSLG